MKVSDFEDVEEEAVSSIPEGVKWYSDFDSSNVQAIAYDELTNRLFVNFKGGTTYEYTKVKPEIWDDLIVAESKGIFLNRAVKPFYSYNKL